MKQLTSSELRELAGEARRRPIPLSDLIETLQRAADALDEARDGCICHGNWRAIVSEYDALIGKTFVDPLGQPYVFFGIVHAEDDYYYGMQSSNGHLRLLTCVGHLIGDVGHGFTLAEPAHS